MVWIKLGTARNSAKAPSRALSARWTWGPPRLRAVGYAPLSSLQVVCNLLAPHLDFRCLNFKSTPETKKFYSGKRSIHNPVRRQNKVKQLKPFLPPPPTP